MMLLKHLKLNPLCPFFVFDFFFTCIALLSRVSRVTVAAEGAPVGQTGCLEAA